MSTKTKKENDNELELELDISRFKEENAVLSASLSEALAEAKNYHEQTIALNREKQKLERENRQLEVNYENEKSHAELLAVDLEEARVEAAGYKADLDLIRNELRKFEEQGLTVEQFEELQNEINYYQRIYEDTMARLELKNEEIINLRAELEMCQHYQTEYEFYKEMFEKQLKDLEQLRLLKMDMTRIDEQKTHLLRLEENIQSLREENNRLRFKQVEQEELERQLNQVKNNLRDEVERREFLEIQVKKYVQEYKRIKAREEENISDENRIFESFQQIIEEGEKEVAKIKPYLNDQDALERVLAAAREGQFTFEEKMVRGFLAAMRSTRFIILKGLSGTGKTSLPIIVAKALGGKCKTISVQPSWKSKTDLIGFYNHFSDRFLATSFTEELLKAQLPSNRDKFYFIVLDEMNLARVEYYFSDFNSKLELREEDQVIELFDSVGKTSGTLTEYIKDGNKLRIPDNVFFVGTINDDESTNSISDKIYDRAQVIDFQTASGDSIGHMEDIRDGESLSFRQFKEQKKAMESVLVKKDMEKINQLLTLLDQELNVRIGNRPKRHIEAFLRAYETAQWDKNEGIDLQIVSKLIPKIQYSYMDGFENRISIIQEKTAKYPYTKRALEQVKRGF